MFGPQKWLVGLVIAIEVIVVAYVVTLPLVCFDVAPVWVLLAFALGGFIAFVVMIIGLVISDLRRQQRP